MDRTEEYKSYQKENTGREEKDSNPGTENSTHRFLSIAKELRTSLNSCYTSLESKRAQATSEIEHTIKSLSQESIRIIDLLNSLEDQTEYIEHVVKNIRAVVKKTEIKLEERKSKRITKQSTLNLVLEPEKAKVSPKTREEMKGGMMQVLQEENTRILERVRCTDREIVQIRRRVSEIDTLQRLITQELFIQDERIDIVLNKTAIASVDVKISRAYIKNSGAKKKVAKRFISLFIIILSIVLLILYYSHK